MAKMFTSWCPHFSYPHFVDPRPRIAASVVLSFNFTNLFHYYSLEYKHFSLEKVVLMFPVKIYPRRNNCGHWLILVLNLVPKPRLINYKMRHQIILFCLRRKFGTFLTVHQKMSSLLWPGRTHWGSTCHGGFSDSTCLPSVPPRYPWSSAVVSLYFTFQKRDWRPRAVLCLHLGGIGEVGNLVCVYFFFFLGGAITSPSEPCLCVEDKTRKSWGLFYHWD